MTHTEISQQITHVEISQQRTHSEISQQITFTADIPEDTIQYKDKQADKTEISKQITHGRYIYRSPSRQSTRKYRTTLILFVFELSQVSYTVQYLYARTVLPKNMTVNYAQHASR
jgi:hypothetical protein